MKDSYNQDVSRSNGIVGIAHSLRRNVVSDLLMDVQFPEDFRRIEQVLVIKDSDRSISGGASQLGLKVCLLLPIERQ